MQLKCFRPRVPLFAGSSDITRQIRDQDFDPRFFNLTPGASPLVNSTPARIKIFSIIA